MKRGRLGQIQAAPLLDREHHERHYGHPNPFALATLLKSPDLERRASIAIA